MDTFPRRGTELSLEAMVTFPSQIFERPALHVEFSNGWFEDRAIGETSRYKEFKVHFNVNQYDWNVIMAFLEAHDLSVQPFFLEHPYFGTGIVNYALTELPSETVISGNPAWFSFDLAFRGAF
jgi:phage-related protein